MMRQSAPLAWPESKDMLPSARQVPSVRRPRRIANWLAFCLVTLLLICFFAPWRQNLFGDGQVIALSPDERMQPVQATISGRIVRWHVQEGQPVSAGDAIVDLADNDPQRLTRLEGTLDAAFAQRDAYQSRVRAYEDRVEAIQRSQRAQVTTAEAERDIAVQNLSAKRELFAAAEATLATAEMQQVRVRELAASGLASTRDRELAELSAASANATIASRRAELRAAEGNLASKRASLQRTIAQVEADLRVAHASLDSARAELSTAEAKVLDAESDLAQQAAQSVTAPRDGIIQRIAVPEGSAQVSRGTTLAYLVPQSNTRSVAISVDGNDAALITPGRHVRIQFEGWPAVQFSGWPSVAVGSFGGIVSFVDPSDDGRGDFRIVVVPDENDEPWPDARFLRQGTRAKGWVLLEEVSIGFEIWRQLNGFPPSYDHAPEEGEY